MPQAGGFSFRDFDSLAILHVAGMRSRAGEAEAGESLIQQLERHLARREGLQRRPDLIVVSGNLADSGLPGDYQRAMEFLARLADTAGVPHRHVAVVPGDHDVNRHACAAHFNWQAGEGREPVWPYFQKWSHYAAALGQFYGNECPDITFTPDEPWTLFEMPALRVAVAALNSTMAVSHRAEDRYPLITRDQIDWFAARLARAAADGWRRLAVIHDHDAPDAPALDAALCASGLVSLLLSGNPGGSRELPSGFGVHRAVPGGYEIITARPARATSAPAPVAAPATATTAGRDAYHAQRDIHFHAGPAGTARDTADGVLADTFLARVLEVTKLRFPRATVTRHERDGIAYLRVIDNCDVGPIDMHPVGVIDGDASEEGVESFVRSVHGVFAAADPTVRSELIYEGAAGPPELATYARENGVRLRSFIEYQGLLDLRPLVAAQRSRIDADPLYPERLYVQQRFRIDIGTGTITEARGDLLAHAADWLGDDVARLLVVLGDFGRGKTSFLRQLTRLLTSRFPDLSPVLVELRNLKREQQTLDALLAQHLYEKDVHDVTGDKLRYMIRKGKVALLFDGFDEFELRVGYDSATKYLQTLLDSLTGEAKVVLTSRTQHFLSTGQVHQAVRTGLGERIEPWTGAQVVILEDFTESQILEFLTGLYGGDEERAQARLSLISGIANLLELTRNPRMLAFVAGLDEQRLLAVRAEGGDLTAAGLYKEIIDYWLAKEEERTSHRPELGWLSSKKRFAVCTDLALLLWRTEKPEISLHDLDGQVTATLQELSERGFTSEQTTHSIAAGSLLVRTEDGAFTFIHRSVMEWLVSAHAANDLNGDGTARLLASQRMSPLMAAFLADLAGHDAAREWAARTLGDHAGPETAKQNALTVWNQLRPPPAASPAEPMTPPADGLPDVGAGGPPGPQPLDLAGVDLRNYDLKKLDLRGASLRGATLRGMRLDGADLAGADLTGADLAGVTMTGGSLRGAIVAGSKWDRAAILGTDGMDDPALATAPELAAAAIAGRDNADVVINTPNAKANCVAFTADGSLLAYGSGREVKIADLGTGRVLRVLPGHQETGLQGIVTAVAFSPDATTLATGSADGSAHTWDVATGAYRTALIKDPGNGAAAPVAHEDPVTAIAFSPDGSRVVTASTDFTARTWDAATGAPGFSCPAQGPVTLVAFSPDGTVLVTVSSLHHAGFRSEVIIWDVATGTRRRTLPEDRGEVHAVAFSPGGGILATAYHDQTVVLWDTATDAQHATLTGSRHVVRAIAFSPNGIVKTASHTPSWLEARSWDAATGTHLDGGERLADDGQRHISAIAFSADLALVATAYDDKTICVWDTASGAQRAMLARPQPAARIAFSPDGTLVAITSPDGTVRIWDVATGTNHAPAAGDRPWVGLHAASPDGNLTVTGVPRDGTVQIRDTAGGTLRTIVTGHRDLVTAVAISPDGTLLATAFQDGTIRFLDIATETTVARLVILDNGGLAALRPDGGYKLTGDPADRLWWAIKLRCFAPGELDQYVPEIRALPVGSPILPAFGNWQRRPRR